MKNKILALLASFGLGLFVVLCPVISGVLISIYKLKAPLTYFLQGAFMFIPILVFALRCLCDRKLDYQKFYLTRPDYNKYLLLYIFAYLILIPVSVKGFKYVDPLTSFGIVYLYIVVGIAEELYYRGIICGILKKHFKDGWVIAISTLIFGLFHATTAFVTPDIKMVLLTILNALLFGFMAASLLLLTEHIYPLFVIHALFDILNQFTNLSGNQLFIAEIVRGAMMLILGIGFTVILVNKKKKEALEE